MAYPSDLLRWATTPTTLREEPLEPTKDTGFPVDRNLPAQYFNWLFGVAGDWITWLKDQIDNGWSYNLLPDSDDNRDLGSAAKHWREIYGNDIYGTDIESTASMSAGTTVQAGTQFKLAVARSSIIHIPACQFMPAYPGSVLGWNFIDGTDPAYVNDDYLVSVVNNAPLVAEVHVPQGTKVQMVAVDWFPHDTSGEMKFNAWKVNRENNTSGSLFSTGPVFAAASAARTTATSVTNQNNTGFNNNYGVSGWHTVRLRVQASTGGAAGDKVYGAYLYLTHHSVGVFSDAPDAT